VWVANLGSGTVSRIDPRARQVVATVRVLPGPDGLIASPDGVWVTSTRARALVRIDAGSNRVVGRVDVPASVPPGDERVHRGDVWIGGLVPDQLTAFDPGAGSVDASRALPGAAWTADDGTSTWIGSVTARSVTRVDDASGGVVSVTPLPDVPSRLAVAGGTVWVTSFDGRTIHALDAGTGRLRSTISTPGRPKGIAADAGGRIVVSGHTPGLLPRRLRWVDPRPGHGFLLLLDRGASRPTRRRTDARQGVVAVTGSTAWVVDVDGGGVRAIAV
jgi:YVTN family beta-propeller protein